MRPIIGLTMDWAEEGTFSKRPHYALRASYFDIIYKAGGLPLAIPYINSAIDEYLDKVSALIVPGGDFAFKRDWYINPDEEKPFPPSRRLEFDLAIIQSALEKNIPFLGICAGMQMLGGISGAKMTPNINKHLNTLINHSNHCPPEEFAHQVNVRENSLLHKITNKGIFSVNTAHSEAIVETPDILLACGHAEDGAIEAIERIDKDFALGVQWHPEFFMHDESDPNFLIVKALVDKARGRM
jgi:putative glutamine amidotransferase